MYTNPYCNCILYANELDYGSHNYNCEDDLNCCMYVSLKPYRLLSSVLDMVFPHLLELVPQCACQKYNGWDFQNFVLTSFLLEVYRRRWLASCKKKLNFYENSLNNANFTSLVFFQLVFQCEHRKDILLVIFHHSSPSGLECHTRCQFCHIFHFLQLSVFG